MPTNLLLQNGLLLFLELLGIRNSNLQKLLNFPKNPTLSLSASGTKRLAWDGRYLVTASRWHAKVRL